jgi:hypothetical protein
MLACVVLALAASAVLIFWRFNSDLTRAPARVEGGGTVIATGCGPIEYSEAGTGIHLLAVHGSGGG